MQKWNVLALACFMFSGAVQAATSYNVSTFAGSPGTVINSIDATGSAAQFSAPRGIAVDSSGNLYIADSSNHTIRKVTSGGAVTTLAGTAGTSGNQNGTGTATLFNEPFGVAVDSAGNVFVADTNNNAIRKITPAGIVTTLAGGSGAGTTNGTGTAAKFHEPRAIAIDSSGTLYVADYENHMVRKVTSSGAVTTLAGGTDISGYVDGQGTSARFMSLQGIAVDSNGNVYVTESGNRDVRKITASGLVTTFASGAGKFGEPRGIAIDSSGNFYVGDYSSNVVRKVTPAGTVSTHAGTSPTAGSADGTTSSALFNGPSGVAVDSAGNVYVADTLNNTVRKISSTGTVTTLAGLAGRTSSVDGASSAARFEDPYAIAADGSGNLYVADATDHSIRKIASDGNVTTLAGKGGSFGSSDGTGTAARFKGPLGIAADSAGNVYVADTGNAIVRKITAAGVVTTLAGSAGQSGSTDGTGTAARFMSPYGITVDSSGTVYVVESSAAVRKITASGVVTTLAGTSGTNGFTDGTGTAARFSVPFDIAADGSGNLYVSDHGNHAVRKITPAGIVTTLAGSGNPGKTDATGTAASFKFPSGIAADSAGNVYLADTDNQVIRKITAAGAVTTIAGTGALGSADGTGTVASFYNPKDVAVDASGNLYIVDRGNHTIRLASVIQDTTTNTPSCTLSANPATITAGATSTLTASCSPAATVYAWSDAACSSASASCSVAPTVTTTYTVSGSNAAGAGKVASAAVVVGTATTLPVTQDLVTVYEFYHAGLDHYFRTADAGEASGIDNGAAGAGWVRTGDDFRAYSAATTSGGAVPVCRFYGSVSPGPNSHFYTASQEECAGLKALQQSTPDGEKRWNYEGLAFAVALPSTSGCPAGSTSIYRLYNNGFAKGADSNHRYTSLQSEYQRLQSAGWGGESVVMCSPSASSSSSLLSPPAGVTLANAGSQTVGGNAFSSSTQLTLSWAAPSGYTVDHYAISASESVGNTSLSYSVAASGTSATLTGLKSGTLYNVVVSACKDAACAEAGSAAAVSGTTSEEYWQLQGSGNSTSGLTRIVSDGNALISATRIGPDAGGSTASRIQLYYKSSLSHGPSIAVTSQDTDAAISSSYLSFTSFGTSYGLVTPSPSATLVSEAGGVHAVPLKSGGVRLFFDPLGSDRKSRIMYLDSKDGYVGRDFNSGSATNCSTAADYNTGGGCAPTVIIGVEGDSIQPNSKIAHARQFKVGFPALNDWRWDQAVGTFMVFTTDSIPGCTTYMMNHAYAIWDGTNWVVQYESNGCPKLFKSAQAAFPLHIGGVNYKLYYGDPSVTTGRLSTSLPFLGPKKLIYADGTLSGSASSVDFEDWEATSSARNVNFLWPNGNRLDDQAEGYIDDYHFLTPTGSLDLQVMYLAITNGTETPFGAAAVLLNP